MRGICRSAARLRRGSVRGVPGSKERQGLENSHYRDLKHAASPIGKTAEALGNSLRKALQIKEWADFSHHFFSYFQSVRASQKPAHRPVFRQPAPRTSNGYEPEPARPGSPPAHRSHFSDARKGPAPPDPNRHCIPASSFADSPGPGAGKHPVITPKGYVRSPSAPGQAGGESWQIMAMPFCGKPGRPLRGMF